MNKNPQMTKKKMNFTPVLLIFTVSVLTGGHRLPCPSVRHGIVLYALLSNRNSPSLFHMWVSWATHITLPWNSSTASHFKWGDV